eukprot:GGOE01015058.1.p1 GENE.GGOE01015058.1~~GGOE01015058.1.p1  ORF type:complete len:277 (-),score=83.75 GGOE01015058.1:320-1150(-)
MRAASAKDALRHVRFVLVEPQGPLNIGSVARAMKNMGLRQLYLVNPRCPVLCEESRQMAVHAADLLEAAVVVPTLADALQDCRRTVATTHRPSSTVPLERLEGPTEALPWLLEEGPAALVFGAENRGLTNVELGFCQRYLTLPVHSEYPVLNLAQAAMVSAYELHRLSVARAPPPADAAVDCTAITCPSEPAQSTATRGEYEGFYAALQHMLWEVRYFRTERRSSLPYEQLSDDQKEWVMRRMFTFRGIFDRAALSSSELRHIRGLVSSVQRAIRK